MPKQLPIPILKDSRSRQITPVPPTQVATPVASPGSGEYPGEQLITLACATVGATIFYQIVDLRSAPGDTWTTYTAKFLIQTQRTLYVIAERSGLTPSNMAQFDYDIPAIPPDPPDPPDPQSITLTAQTDGIVGEPGSASVMNEGTLPQSWTLSASAGLTPSPSSGTTAPGATTPIALTYTTAGSKTLTLTNTSGGNVVGSPRTISVVNPGALLLTAPSNGTVGGTGAASVTNTGGVAQDWSLAATAGLTATPSSGTTGPGATTPIVLNYLTDGSKSLTLTNLSGGDVVGSPAMITVFPLLSGGFFIDFDGGNDTNDGLSTATPWKHCPGDPNALANPLAYVPVAGDRFRFKGGVSYIGQLNVTRSGAVGSPIYYDGNHDGSYGTGRAIMDVQWAPGRAINASANVKNIWVKGFLIWRVGGWRDDDPQINNSASQVSDPPGGTAIHIQDGGNDNWVIENCFIRQVGQWRNCVGITGANSITGTGINAKNLANLQLINCDLTEMRTPVSLKASQTISGVLIDNCRIGKNVVWAIDMAPHATGAVLENIEVKRTSIWEMTTFDQGNWLGGGEKPHSDGLFLRTAATKSTWTNIRIHRCKFYDDNPGASAGGTAAIYMSQGSSALIYNNLFVGGRWANALIRNGYLSSGGQQTFIVANNTFIQVQKCTTGGTSALPRTQIYRNNVFYRATSQSNLFFIGRDSGSDQINSNYNTFWDPNYTAAQRYVLFNGGYKVLAAEQAAGRELQSQYADPMLTNPTAISSERDGHLLPGSPCIGTGENLLYLGIPAEDYDGNPRPAVGPWCQGAFEFQ